MTFTFHPYDILCKIFGPKDVVRTRRHIYSAAAAEACLQSNVFQIIPSGSRGEGLELEGSDFDVMFKNKLIRVYESTDKRDTYDKAISIIMEKYDTQIGFTRLRVLPLNTSSSMLVRNFHGHMLDNLTVEHDCIKYLSSALVREFNLGKDCSVHGPCLKHVSVEVEYLHCLQCKEWISCAQPWTTRPRGVWPTSEVINDITQYGVLFVPVGCKTSEYEYLEWRISFSIAEQQLIYSFTHVQFLCYAMLKTILSDVVKRLYEELLCSYFVKTIMFWISEEKDLEYWKEQNIVQCYLSCLKRLIYCVEYRTCLHYFIPEINFFEDRFTDNEQKYLVKTLYDVYSRGWEGLLLTETFKGFMEKYNRNTLVTSSAVAPVMWIKVFGIIEDNNLEVYNRVLKYLVCNYNTSTVWMLTLYVYKLLTENKSLFQDDCNKYLYRQLKSVLPHVLLSTKFDCVTGWCYLASLFYQLKLYDRCQYIVNYCLHKCTTDKIWLNVSYIEIPSDIQRLLIKNKYFTRIMQHHFVTGILLSSPSLLPAELADTFDDKLIFDGYVILPPVAYICFLDFLCNHHLQDNRAKKQSFRNLQTAVLERRFIVNEGSLVKSENILGVALQMMDFS